MPYEIYTGMPGGGKTSLLVERLLEAHALNLKHRKSGKPQIVINGVEYLERPLYVAGVDSLQDGLAEPLEDPSKWQDLPDGSLIFVDEMWKWFGHLEDASRKPPPPHVQGIAEHRHKGMDFIGTTQGPGQIYPFMRPLLGPHHHVVRRFGSTFIDVYTWGELVQDPQSQGMRERGTKTTRTIPSIGHKLYKSAAAHTIKTKIPFKLIGTGLACLLALPLLWFGLQKMRPGAIAHLGKAEAAEGQLAGTGGSASDGPHQGKAVLSATEYAAQFVPRILGLHGSEPIFGERTAKSEPATYCMISGSGADQHCGCYTEQATKIYDVVDSVCRDWATHGRYDPFRAAPKAVESGIARIGSKEKDGPGYTIAPNGYPPVVPQVDGPHLGGIGSGSPLDVGSHGMGAVQGQGG